MRSGAVGAVSKDRALGSGTGLAEGSSVTPPRQVLAGATYLISRRCSERRFFLRPSRALNEVFLFLLAAAAARYGLLVHAYCVMSNHFHLVVTDPDARLPEFHQYLDGLVARAVNRLIEHRESFWDPESYSAVPLLTAEDILAKCAYVLANPVAAGLVRHAREWPGLWSDPAWIGGEPLAVERPSCFFREAGRVARSAKLVLQRPPGFEDDGSFREALEAAVRRAEEEAAARLEREQRSFAGAARVQAQDPHGRPSTVEPRRTLKPRVAARDAGVRREALLRFRSFVDAYREALAAWRTGLRDVLFPPGTWAMRVRHGARCAVTACA